MALNTSSRLTALFFKLTANTDISTIKRYSLPDSLMFVPKQAIIDYMNENNLQELTVHESKAFNAPDYMYCKLHGVGEKGMCGKSLCNDYKPRNRKSGMCLHQGRLYEEGKEITIKIKQNENER